MDPFVKAAPIPIITVFAGLPHSQAERTMATCHGILESFEDPQGAIGHLRVFLSTALQVGWRHRWVKAANASIAQGICLNDHTVARQTGSIITGAFVTNSKARKANKFGNLLARHHNIM